MMSTIEIRKAGYPKQHRFHDFRRRYWPLVPLTRLAISAAIPDRDFTTVIATALLGEEGPESWQMGKDKVFLKAHHDTTLESA